MRKNAFWAVAALAGASLFTPSKANAQEAVVVQEEVVVGEVECRPKYYTTWREKWFIQAGEGISAP